MTLKAKLLATLAGKNRGLLLKPGEAQVVLDVVDRLEEINPTPTPTEALDLLEGDWRLLYTTSTSLLNIDLPPFTRLGQVYQCLRPSTSKIYNIAEIIGLPYLDGLVATAAKFQAISEKRVDVKFQRWIVGLQGLLEYQSPAELIEQIEADKRFTALDIPIDESNQDNWLDFTYLDEDLRICRGHKGNLFVLSKV
ncbi:MAG TPA: PAP/fibrillin family protein [Oscillatoriaceae cyanobacterium M33_DOE_052]|uniref:Fibrillin n=1 Tax=Planktothricoides sp. SpSt-374 TaxID=2282167 RepID=A0A7C3ZXV2_9CYAN|nr:PAP/fibrillin family protein [Oscillatoriaceae cyanobacterium M33_DOE_052]